MKFPFIRIGIAALVYSVIFAAPGCAPYAMRYSHLRFEKQDGLEILERSIKSPETQEGLAFAKYGLPLKLRLARPNYTLHFDTPLNMVPVLFLSARDPQGAPLQVSGPNVVHSYPASAKELDGYEWAFIVKNAGKAPLSITITDAAGNVLGTEKLRYRVVSRGYAYGIEWI